MNKYPLIGGSICAVVLIVLASMNNIVGYQTVQASNQKIMSTEIDGKELLFQTIVNMVNNKEIQKVILGSEITGKRFFAPGVRFSVFTPPVLTEKFLKRMYTMGVILTRTLSKSMIHSLLEKYPVSNQGVQKEISAIVEKDTRLKGEVTQLSDLSCNCGNSNFTWRFPFLCYLVLLPLFIFLFYIMTIPMMIIFQIYIHLGLPWALTLVEIWLILIVLTWYVSAEVLGCTWWNFIPL
jgi:hypothetical protein